MSSQLKKEWDYRPGREHVMGLAAAAGSVGIYAIALSSIFNPLASAAISLLGLSAFSFKRGNSENEESIGEHIRAGRLIPLPDKYEWVQDVVDDMTAKAEMQSYRVLLATRAYAECSVPLFQSQETKDLYLDSRLKSFASCLTGLNTIITSAEFLERHSPNEIKHVMAHEVAHGKNDDSSYLPHQLSTWATGVDNAIWAGMFTALGLELGALDLAADSIAPALAKTANAVSFYYFSSLAARMLMNRALQMVEYRADRSALYLTQNLNSAISFMEGLRGDRTRAKRPLWALLSTALEEATHPSDANRIDYMQKAWRTITGYAPPAAIRSPSQDYSPG